MLDLIIHRSKQRFHRSISRNSRPDRNGSRSNSREKQAKMFVLMIIQKFKSFLQKRKTFHYINECFLTLIHRYSLYYFRQGIYLHY